MDLGPKFRDYVYCDDVYTAEEIWNQGYIITSNDILYAIRMGALSCVRWIISDLNYNIPESALISALFYGQHTLACYLLRMHAPLHLSEEYFQGYQWSTSYAPLTVNEIAMYRSIGINLELTSVSGFITVVTAICNEHNITIPQSYLYLWLRLYRNDHKRTRIQNEISYVLQHQMVKLTDAKLIALLIKLGLYHPEYQCIQADIAEISTACETTKWLFQYYLSDTEVTRCIQQLST